MKSRLIASLAVAAAFLLPACESPNAASTCPDPRDARVSYVGGSERDPSVCATIRFICAEGTAFSDGCGCGCVRD